MKKSTPLILSFLSICIALNYVGANIALFLKLPIYLDTFGTILASLTLGPLAGAGVAFLSALIGWMTTDIFSLYYSPAAIIIALSSTWFFKEKGSLKLSLLWKTLLVALPGTLVASAITVLLFGGITSSGSSLIVQALRGMGVNPVLSIVLVQILTDYADKLIVLGVCLAALPRIKAVSPKIFA